jgi:hypothetical protein
MEKVAGMRRKAAENLAIQGLAYLAGDPERLSAFLAITGIGPDTIRGAAREPGFLAGVLDHIASDERLLLAFAADTGIDPAEITRGRTVLAGIPKGDEGF